MKADVYKLYSCRGDDGLGRFLDDHGVKVTYKNMQVPYVRSQYYALLEEKGMKELGGCFPLLVISDRLVVGFKPKEILKIINEGK